MVFDVLRATSTMVTALGSGAAAVLPAAGLEEARALKADDPSRVLGGERRGHPPEGFDRGNSPLEYLAGVEGREVILTTTNGTWAVGRCAGAREILAAALLNLDATARALSGCDDLLIVCAGTFDTPALEDHYGAGALVAALRAGAAQRGAPEPELSDSALLVEALFRQHGREGARACLSAARNGRALLGRGWGDQLEWCARFSEFDLVARFAAGRCERAG